MAVKLLALLLLAWVSTCVGFVPSVPKSILIIQSEGLSMTSTSSAETKTAPEIEVIRQPDEEFLEKKGVFDWDTWGCGVSKFPWTYGEIESCYLLAGKVTVTPTDGRAAVSFGKGDFVTFPAGMSCTWDVTEAVKKHYMFF